MDVKKTNLVQRHKRDTMQRNLGRQWMDREKNAIREIMDAISEPAL